MSFDDQRINSISRLSQQVFKLNGLLQEEGMRMSKDSPVNPSRWRILGVLVRSNAPLTVPQIAREFGQSRQSVQRLVDAMYADGYLEYIHNPAHAKSRLVGLTQLGEQTYESLIDQREASLTNMAEALDSNLMLQTEQLLAAWIEKLERISSEKSR